MPGGHNSNGSGEPPDAEGYIRCYTAFVGILIFDSKIHNKFINELVKFQGENPRAPPTVWNPVVARYFLPILSSKLRPARFQLKQASFDPEP